MPFSPALISSEVLEVWLVSNLDITTLSPTYEAGYATINRTVNAEQLGSKLKGYVDEIQNQQVVWTPNQMYLLPVKANQIGFLRPADRTLVAEWLNPAVRSELPDYLFKQSSQPEEYLSFMVAINLEHAFSPVAIAQRLDKSELLKDADPKTIAKAISELNGMSVIVGRKSLSECIVSFEFKSSPTSLGPIAVPLLDEALKSNGLAIPEILDWKTTIEGNTLKMKGAISASTLDSLIHIFSLTGQAENISHTLEHSSETSSSAKSNAYDSKRYFDRITSIVEKVRAQEKQSVATRARWSDQQARRIDELPTLNVDQEMVAYGVSVAELLRASALTIRSGNIQAGAQRQQVGGYYTSGNSANATAEYGRMIQSAASSGGSIDYRQTLTQIDMLTGEIRRTMTEKYSIQF